MPLSLQKLFKSCVKLLSVKKSTLCNTLELASLATGSLYKKKKNTAKENIKASAYFDAEKKIYSLTLMPERPLCLRVWLLFQAHSTYGMSNTTDSSVTREPPCKFEGSQRPSLAIRQLLS